jgi:menaquinone-dependent protoporphyrinogen IX oxidase
MASMKILIAFYSRTGNVRRVAQVIAEALASANVEASVDVEEIIDKKDRSGALGAVGGGRDATLRRATEIEEPKHDPAAYDLVIVGTPVWAWTMTPAVRAYLERQRERLPAVAFFSIAASTGAEKTVAAMVRLVGKEPRAMLSLTRGHGLGDEILEHARRFAAGLIPAP